jgi:hypothetical protein
MMAMIEEEKEGQLPTAPKRQQVLSSPIEREVVNLKDRSFEAGLGKPAGV